MRRRFRHNFQMKISGNKKREFCKIAIFIFSLFLSSIPLQAKNKSKIVRISYHGWQDSYLMSNGIVSLVIVPQINRIMSYSFVKGKNIFWENSKEYGNLYEIKKIWPNYGGYKVWPAPQNAWWKGKASWPPDPYLDYGRNNVEIVSPSKIKLTGAPSLEMGILFIKEIELLPNSSHVIINQKMVNISSREIEWSIWDVTQLPLNAWVLFPIKNKSKFINGLNPLSRILPQGWEIYKKDNWIIIPINKKSKNVWKIGSDSDGGWIAYVKENFIYFKCFPYFPSRKYPDGGCSVEVFKGHSYMEMEVLSPVVKLKPGEEYNFREKWYLYKCGKIVKTKKEAKNLVKQFLSNLLHY